MKDIEFNKVNRSVLKNMIVAFNKEKESEEKSVISDDIKDINKIIENKKSPDSIGVFKELSDEQVEALMNEEKASKGIRKLFSGNLSDISALKPAIMKGDRVALGKPEINPDDPIDPEDPIIPDDPTPLDPDDPTLTLINVNPGTGITNHSITSGDAVAIMATFNNKTYRYTLVSATNQTVGFEMWDDGRLVIHGAGISVTTPDNQYSDIMLLGHTNTIITGENGETHIANNVYYSSSEGGSQVTTWENTLTPVDEGYTYDDSNVTIQKSLSRGSAAESVSFSPDDKLELTLTNPFTGSNYKYIITNRTTINIDASFEFLSNGRLVITGSGLEISAASNQMDDIILMGSSCIVNTGNYADTVRNGVVIDDNMEHYYANCMDNTINTGSGDDYVKIYNPTVNSIDLGVGNDKLLYVDNTYNLTTIQNAELIQNITLATATRDNIDGWASQGQSGDCQIFSLLNSLGHCQNNLDLSQYITVSVEGSTYTVVFKNYDAPDDKTNTVTFTAGEFNAYNGAYMDIDTKIFDYAFNKLIQANTGCENWVAYMEQVLDEDPFGHETYKKTLSEYILGTSKAADFYYDVTEINKSHQTFSILWELYNNNMISNLTFGFSVYDEAEQVSDTSVGKIVAHAYAVKNVGSEPGGARYIELVNPWDDGDVVRFNWDYVFSFPVEFSVIGYDISDLNSMNAQISQSSAPQITTGEFSLFEKAAQTINPFAAELLKEI